MIYHNFAAINRPVLNLLRVTTIMFPLSTLIMIASSDIGEQARHTIVICVHGCSCNANISL